MTKILVIEDNNLFLEVLLLWLEEKGMEAIGAHKGQLSLQLAKEKMPDLIICDIQMPELDGYQVLEILRQDSVTKKIPLIFLTSEQTDSKRHRAMELGASDYLDKCCGLEELSQAIEVQLR